MDAQKKAMVAAMEKALGVVTTACKTVGISRQTHYNWLNDPDYAAAIEDVSEVAVDFAESHLHKLIKDGNPAATIFFLKTKGKGRGYVERQEIAVAEKKPLSWFTDENATVS
jgi:hypothetical protein